MILFYPNNDIHGKRLEKAVAQIILQETIAVFREFETLLLYLKRPNNKHRILLVHAPSKEQLQEMQRNAELLDNLKKIFVLSDNSSAVFQTACTLYPSYMTNVCSDFRDVQDVLTKIRSRFSGI